MMHHRDTLRRQHCVFTGTITGPSVQVLLDGESTHNFIQSRVAHHLGLTIDQSTSFPVLVGSGDHIQSEGMVHNVSLIIQGATFATDFYVLPLYGPEMVLGVAWLANLGLVITNYAASTFQFVQGPATICWARLSADSPQQTQLNSLR